MRRHFILALPLLLTLAGPVIAQGVSGAGPASAASPMQRRRPLDELGLTPAQRRQFNQLRKPRNSEQSRLGNEIRGLRRALADVYRFYPLDEARAAAMVEQISQLEAQRLRLQLQIQVELRRILTPQQFNRFTQIMESSQRPTPLLPGPYA